MVIELVTPLVLATAPVRIDVPQGAYDHRSQVMAFATERERTTWIQGASRTFDALGHPNDSDQN